MKLQPKNKLPTFEPGSLERICKILADTTEGMSGSEIEHGLRQLEIDDPDPKVTKWKRLYNALALAQNRHQVGNHVFLFIKHAMAPARYSGDRNLFRKRQDLLNVPLALMGFQLLDTGLIGTQSKAATLDEALERCNRLRAELTRRGIHPEVLKYCQAQLLQDNYFHAVLEAMKSISARIQKFTSITGDGAQLITDAFAVGKTINPRYCISSLKSETEQGEQRGFVSLVIGMFGVFRNPAAHAPVIEWPMSEQDALDMMSTISYVHRKLDAMRPYPGYIAPP